MPCIRCAARRVVRFRRQAVARGKNTRVYHIFGQNPFRYSVAPIPRPGTHDVVTSRATGLRRSYAQSLTTVGVAHRSRVFGAIVVLCQSYQEESGGRGGYPIVDGDGRFLIDRRFPPPSETTRLTRAKGKFKL